MTKLFNQQSTGIIALVLLFFWDNKKEEEQLAQISRDETLSRLPLRLSTNRVVELVQLRDTVRPVSVDDFPSQIVHVKYSAILERKLYYSCQKLPCTIIPNLCPTIFLLDMGIITLDSSFLSKRCKPPCGGHILGGETGWGPDNISSFWSFVAKNPTRALWLPSEYDLIDIPKV